MLLWVGFHGCRIVWKCVGLHMPWLYYTKSEGPNTAKVPYVVLIAYWLGYMCPPSLAHGWLQRGTCLSGWVEDLGHREVSKVRVLQGGHAGLLQWPPLWLHSFVDKGSNRSHVLSETAFLWCAVSRKPGTVFVKTEIQGETILYRDLLLPFCGGDDWAICTSL